MARRFHSEQKTSLASPGPATKLKERIAAPPPFRNESFNIAASALTSCLFEIIQLIAVATSGDSNRLPGADNGVSTSQPARGSHNLSLGRARNVPSPHCHHKAPTHHLTMRRHIVTNTTVPCGILLLLSTVAVLATTTTDPSSSVLKTTNNGAEPRRTRRRAIVGGTAVGNNTTDFSFFVQAPGVRGGVRWDGSG